MTKATLRVCASCEWVFKKRENKETCFTCPQCGFGSYGARQVYGDKAYKYEKNQHPWKHKKLTFYEHMLNTEIKRWT